MSMAGPDGRNLLKAIKATAGGDGPELALPVGAPAAAYLRPLPARAARLRRRDVECLTEWRNCFVTSFLTEFVATTERTARWLRDVVGPRDDKILFMLDDAEGRTFGYMGLDFIDWERGTGEADSVVRGGDAPPGLMGLALRTLLEWATGQLGLSRLGVRVRSDNPALRFYARNGFEERCRVPLRIAREPGMLRWTEDPSLDSPAVWLVFLDWNAAGAAAITTASPDTRTEAAA
ncbi:MAG: GNAT family N-acetyltransferase [Planctomycetales bacterium]